MPHAPQTRRYDSAGTSKTENTQQIIDLFGFVGLHQLAPVAAPLLAQDGQRGRRSPYPVGALLAACASARAAGSLAEALKLMRRPDTWEQCRANYEKTSRGTVLPATPPNRDQVRYFRKRLREKPEVMDALQLRFQRLAIGQARLLGNLLPGVVPDGANPDWRHAIYTDGTVIAPYSDVKTVIHPRTGEKILIGSRATCLGTARIQTVVTDTSEDGKTAVGVNMVGAYTWTKAGRVVLATGKALRAEQWTVLDLIDSLVALIHELDGSAGDTGDDVAPAIHTLINDRAITGWAVDYLMGAHGMQVLSKAVGSNSSTTASDVEIKDDDLKDRVNRLAAEFDTKPNSPQAQILRRDVLADMIRYHQRFPVGLSLYPTSRHGFDLVRSEVLDVKPAVHSTTDGRTCAHPLVVDDGALFLVEDHPEENYRVKSRLLPCRRSTRSRGADRRWSTRGEYTIPCGAGDFVHVEEWEPSGVRHTPDTTGDKAPADRVGWRLRPLNRADDLVAFFNDQVPMHQISRRKFSDHYGRRNDAESYNQWYQQSLPHHGRAATEIIEGQELDFLLAGLLNNSITWHNHKR